MALHSPSYSQLGELTDKGRETTLELGKRLRNLYVDQLKFMPDILTDTSQIYLRTTYMPRALESLQQSFWGLYPAATRDSTIPPPIIVTRTASEETLAPNDGSCPRLAQLIKAFAQRTADRWNNTTEMDYLNKLMGKWMPEDSKRVAVDSHPRLSGIMDTINSTRGHGPDTRLPPEFYDQKGIEIIEKIGIEEWFSGYQESEEYRTVGIGGLVGDIVSRMMHSVDRSSPDGIQVGTSDHRDLKLCMSGCHDTSLASLLVSFGMFERQQWPPYTSHIALELFKRSNSASNDSATQKLDAKGGRQAGVEGMQSTLWSQIFGSTQAKIADNTQTTQPLGRRKFDKLNEEERKKLDGYYVRVRYNDRPMIIPGCRSAGHHLEGDESFCTLVRNLVLRLYDNLGH